MRARVVAPIVAALLGVAGGAVTAVVTTQDDQPKPPTEARDPLGLGVDLVQLECDPSQGILILGFGDSAPALLAAKAENPDGEPRYLDTEESCDTIFGPERRQTQPRYALFLGPYDGLTEPCTLRMDPVRRGDYVTRLQSGNTDTVKCVCVLGPAAGRPDLRVGMAASEADQVWVRSLQGMFNDVLGEEFPRDWVTGIYDRRTEDVVKDYQRAAGRIEDGVVGADTWQVLTTRICDTYDF